MEAYSTYVNACTQLSTIPWHSSPNTWTRQRPTAGLGTCLAQYMISGSNMCWVTTGFCQLLEGHLKVQQLLPIASLLWVAGWPGPDGRVLSSTPSAGCSGLRSPQHWAPGPFLPAQPGRQRPSCSNLSCAARSSSPGLYMGLMQVCGSWEVEP